MQLGLAMTLSGYGDVKKCGGGVWLLDGIVSAYNTQGTPWGTLAYERFSL